MPLPFPLHQGESLLVSAKPDIRVIWYWLVLTGLRYILAIIALIFLIQITDVASKLLLQILVVVIAATLFFAWASLTRWYRDYFFTNYRCISATGIINKKTSMVSYERIADIRVERNWLERLFGLASIVTQDFSGNCPIIMVGLDYQVAQQITQTISGSMLKVKTTDNV